MIQLRRFHSSTHQPVKEDFELVALPLVDLDSGEIFIKNDKDDVIKSTNVLFAMGNNKVINGDNRITYEQYLQLTEGDSDSYDIKDDRPDLPSFKDTVNVSDFNVGIKSTSIGLYNASAKRSNIALGNNVISIGNGGTSVGSNVYNDGDLNTAIGRSIFIFSENLYQISNDQFTINSVVYSITKNNTDYIVSDGSNTYTLNPANNYTFIVDDIKYKLYYDNGYVLNLTTRGEANTAIGTHIILGARDSSSTAQRSTLVGVGISEGNAYTGEGYYLLNKGDHNIGIGQDSHTSGDSNISIGYQSTCGEISEDAETGEIIQTTTVAGSVAIGSQVAFDNTNIGRITVNGNRSVGIGSVVTVNNDKAVSIGTDILNSGLDSVTLGHQIRNAENKSILIGQNLTDGDISGGIILGRYNSKDYHGADAKFIIADGEQNASHNAFVVDKNYNVFANDRQLAFQSSVDSIYDYRLDNNAVWFGSSSYACTDGVGIGSSAAARSNGSTAIGKNASTDGDYAIAVGLNATSHSKHGVAIGTDASVSAADSVAIGHGSKVTYARTILLGNNLTSRNTTDFIAIGSCNEGNSNNLFEIGFSADKNNRKNLFEINNAGKAYIRNITNDTVKQLASVDDTKIYKHKLTFGEIGEGITFAVYSHKSTGYLIADLYKLGLLISYTCAVYTVDMTNYFAFVNFFAQSESSELIFDFTFLAIDESHGLVNKFRSMTFRSDVVEEILY